MTVDGVNVGVRPQHVSAGVSAAASADGASAGVTADDTRKRTASDPVPRFRAPKVRLNRRI